MNQPKEAEIEQRAYEIWEREGRPEGRHVEHWMQAQWELQGEAEIAGHNASSATAGGSGIAAPAKKTTRRTAAPKAAAPKAAAPKAAAPKAKASTEAKPAAAKPAAKPKRTTKKDTT